MNNVKLSCSATRLMCGWFTVWFKRYQYLNVIFTRVLKLLTICRKVLRVFSYVGGLILGPYGELKNLIVIV